MKNRGRGKKEQSNYNIGKIIQAFPLPLFFMGERC
jgi:hypothetical protein